jgi:hypothetical protein
MCAFNAALNFGKDMVELSVSTLATLVGIQFADVTTFLKRQSDTVNRTSDVRDIAAFVALQREYREAFWTDRRKALAATTGALQVASRRVAKSWTELVREPKSAAALVETKAVSEPVKREPVAHEQKHAPAASAPVETKARSANADAKIRGSRRSKTAKDTPAPTKASVEAARSARSKAGSRKRPGGTRHPPNTTH